MCNKYCLSSWLLLLASGGRAASAFSIPTPFNLPHMHIENIFGTGGGRAPGAPNKIDREDDVWEAAPTDDAEARLIVIQCTDVYTLENFAHMKTLIEETKANADGAKVVSMLTGDFLSP